MSRAPIYTYISCPLAVTAISYISQKGICVYKKKLCGMRILIAIRSQQQDKRDKKVSTCAGAWLAILMHRSRESKGKICQLSYMNGPQHSRHRHCTIRLDCCEITSCFGLGSICRSCCSRASRRSTQSKTKSRSTCLRSSH